MVMRKWRWFACPAIAVVAALGVIFGPPLVQFLAFLAGLFSILFIILSAVDGSEGKIPPWYGGGGSGGGLS